MFGRFVGQTLCLFGSEYTPVNSSSQSFAFDSLHQLAATVGMVCWLSYTQEDPHARVNWYCPIAAHTFDQIPTELSQLTRNPASLR